MKILTIIVSYHFERWMQRCLDSLRQSDMPTDVLVVDNASTDRTVELIRGRYPEVRLIESRENLGFGRANNLGFEVAVRQGYDAVFLLNQDAWIDAHTLEVLAGLSRRYPEYGILSPVHLTGRGDALDQGFASYAGLRDTADITPPGEEPVECRFLNAAFWYIPVPVLKKVGGFCPLFYHYGEDVDYVNRLHYHGFKLGYSPRVKGCHDREFRQVTRATWLRSEEVYLLSEYANINRPWLSAFAYSVLAGCKKSVQALLKGRLKDTGVMLAIVFRLLVRSAEVTGYRKVNQKPSQYSRL